MEPFFAAGSKKRRVSLLSRLPIRSIKSHYRDYRIWRNVVEAEIECQSDRILYLFGVHTKADLGIVSEWWRWREAKYILNLASPYLNGLCLIAGDFNAIAPGDPIRLNTMPHWLRLKLWLQGNRAYRFSIREYTAAGFTDSFRYLNKNEAGFTLPPPRPNSEIWIIFLSTVN